jgi:integrase
MRMNEILQLRFQDLRIEDDVLMMHVVEDTEDMSVKTEAGLRCVPVHPKLLELGFSSYISSRKKAGWLFDGVTASESGRRSKSASNWFTASFRPRVGLDIKGKDFHSFRHTVIDDLKQEQANLYVIKALVGHSDQLSVVSGDDITFDRYGKRYKARILYDMICKLDYSRVLVNVKKWER